MTRAAAALIGLMVLAGCSGSIKTSRVPTAKADAEATGLRYFGSQRIELSVYHVTLPNSASAEPGLRHRIDRMGDVVIDTINDPEALWQVTYQGALFANQTVNLSLSEKGTVKSIGLTSASGSTPVAVGALQAVQKGLETQRDFDKLREQARIDELNRQTNLIKAKQDLEKALGGK